MAHTRSPMRRIDFDITTPSSTYSVLIGERLEDFSDALLSAVRGRKALILCDSGSANAGLETVQSILNGGCIDYAVRTLEGGEKAKNLASLESVLYALIEGRFSRNDLIINLGGGVVGDLGGFAAAIFMRGIGYINIPTTLLSMIDSSIGGKTGIDHFGIKNMLGAFHQPRLVVCASDLIRSLPEREKLSGFGEVLKYYCLSASPSIENAIEYRHIDPELIGECCTIKLCYVSEDIADHGKRRLLNLGHTFGHAFEASSGFLLSHGEAVALGLAAAARFGERIGVTDSSVADKIEELISLLGMSSDFSKYSASASAFLHHDKKSDSGSIEMAFIKSFGQPLLRRVPIEQAVRFLSDLRK